MKRFLAITGLLLLAAPTAAHADPLSPWVQEVIERIDMGIATADAVAGSGTCEPEKDDGYLLEAGAFIKDFVDTRQQITRHNAFLRENTVCFQSDIDLLEDKADELRIKIIDAAEACSLREMRILGDILSFTTKAYGILVNGGTDPSVKSDLLKYEYFWETEDRLNSGSGSGITDTHVDAEECPYTTDYSPRSIGYVLADAGGTTVVIGGGPQDVKKYGCDEEVLPAIEVQTQEMDDMTEFHDATDEFATNITNMVRDFVTNIETSIAALRGDTPDFTFPQENNVGGHEEITGCLRPQVPLTFINPDDGAPDSMLDDYPDYYSEGNMTEIEIAPGVFFQSFNPPPEEALPIGMFLRPAYDYFSIYSNAISMQRRFTNKKTVLGQNRPLPIRAQDPDAFNAGLFLVIYGSDALVQYREIAVSIDQQTAFIEAASRDAIERTLQAYAPLQDAITELSEVVEEDVPAYIQDFGYFMLRQCVNGHCSAEGGTLDTMMKRIYNPSCHPYISGDYTDVRTHIKCLCITKDEDPELGLDVGGCDCSGTPQAGDCQTWCAYCQKDPSQEEQEKYASMEPELFPGCRVEIGDPDTGY